MQRVNFDVGERRHIKLLIHALDETPFAIRCACWELIWAGEIESSGDCQIKEHMIDVMIAPQKRTTYQLRIKYEIADEILVEQMEVVVK